MHDLDHRVETDSRRSQNEHHDEQGDLYEAIAQGDVHSSQDRSLDRRR